MLAFIIYLTAGKQFAKYWPDHKLLHAVFREGLIIKLLQKSEKILPPFIAFFIVWYGYVLLRLQPSNFMPVIAVVSVFIVLCLLLHLYGVYRLGRKAATPLEGKVLVWYQHITKEAHLTAELTPTYLSLAKVLHKALQLPPPHKFMEEL